MCVCVLWGMGVEVEGIERIVCGDAGRGRLGRKRGEETGEEWKGEEMRGDERRWEEREGDGSKGQGERVFQGPALSVGATLAGRH